MKWGADPILGSLASWIFGGIVYMEGLGAAATELAICAAPRAVLRFWFWLLVVWTKKRAHIYMHPSFLHMYYLLHTNAWSGVLPSV